MEKFGTAKQRDDLDWVFANGPEIIGRLERETINALCECLLIECPKHDPDGGFVEYMTVGHYVAGLAKPFLMARDRKGWHEFCWKRVGLGEFMAQHQEKPRSPKAVNPKLCVQMNNKPAWLRRK